MRTMPGRIAALLVTSMLLVAACGSSSPPARTAVASVAPTPQPVVPTSEDLIASALAAGSITFDQSVLYRALALYDSPGLPTEFRSAIPNMDAAGDLLQEIRANESSLSPATLEKLAPYRARPADPISIYNAAPAVARAAGGAFGAIAPGAVVAAAPTATVWKNKPAAGGKARVWVKDSPDAEAQLTTHIADVDRVWNAYPGIFTYPKADQPADPSAAINPDNAIDFYFVPRSDVDPRSAACQKSPTDPDCQSGKGKQGYADRAPGYSGRSSSGYLVIDAAASGDAVVDTMAHELAHAAQFNYDYKDASWLYESTATWVAYKVMKKLNLEPAFAYNQATAFYSGLEKPLTRLDNQNAYGAWLFFLYASMQQGDAVVTDVWSAASAEGVQGEQAVDKVFPFAKSFAGFSVRNWNQKPVTPLYESADAAFPDLTPYPRNKVEAIAGGKEDSLDANLPKLASAYFDYSFESSARAVTFDNSLAGMANAHVWAIKQIGDQWKPPEDWSGLDKKKFCRDAPEENITRLVLIVANSSMTDKLTAPQPPKIKGDAKGCIGWVGTMTGTERWDVGAHRGTTTATLDGLWTPDTSNVSECTGAGSDCVLYRPTGSITWSWDTHTKGGPVTPACDIVLTGSLAAGVVKYDDQQVLTLRRIDDTHYRYFGSAWFLLPTGTEHCLNPITVAVQSNQIFSLSDGPTGGGGGDTCDPVDWQIDVKADTISGSCYAYKNANTSMFYEWHLTRIGPPPGS